MTLLPSSTGNWDEICELHRSNEAYVEYFANIIKNLSMYEANKDKKSYLITSPGEGEGKTTIALNMALVLASWSKRTLLIDANLKRPALGSLLGLSTSPGLLDIISGSPSLEDAIKTKSDFNELHILTSGETEGRDFAANPEGLKKLFDNLKENYDHILVDSSATGESLSPVLLAGVTDGVIMIAHCDRTSTESLKLSKRMIERNNGVLAGVVLNSVESFIPAYYRNA